MEEPTKLVGQIQTADWVTFIPPVTATRAEFVEAIEAGGVAAMEVLARDLKALGLYAARSLSYEGVEYELLEHRLTDEQIPHLRRLCRGVQHHPQ